LTDKKSLLYTDLFIVEDITRLVVHPTKRTNHLF